MTSTNSFKFNDWSKFVACLVQKSQPDYTNRLDYCNAVLASLPKSTIAPLQRVQNAAVRLLRGIGRRDHVIPTLQQLHRITYKPCVQHIGCSPTYLSNLMTATSDLTSRQAVSSASNHKSLKKETFRSLKHLRGIPILSWSSETIQYTIQRHWKRHVINSWCNAPLVTNV